MVEEVPLDKQRSTQEMLQQRAVTDEVLAYEEEEREYEL